MQLHLYPIRLVSCFLCLLAFPVLSLLALYRACTLITPLAFFRFYSVCQMSVGVKDISQVCVCVMRISSQCIFSAPVWHISLYSEWSFDFRLCDLWSLVALGFSSLCGEYVFYSRTFISDTAAVKKNTHPPRNDPSHFVQSQTLHSDPRGQATKVAV